jgi:hypothetical protein
MSPLTRHILPIYVIPKSADAAEFRPVRFAGTGFVAVPYVFVTCAHCVPDELPEDQTYAVLRYEAKTVHRLGQIAQDPSGADLASARVDIPTWPPFELVATAPDVTGLDVGTIGYPGTHPIEQPDGMLRFDQQGRYFQGYVSRAFTYNHPALHRPVRSYEIDMPCPRGLSGAPLVVTTPAYRGQVIGVIYGAHPPFGSQSEAGEIPLPPTVFALAHYFDTLMALRGPATSDRPLSELVPEGGERSPA